MPGFVLGEFEFRPVTSVIALTVGGATAQAGQQFAAIITTGGNVSVTFTGGQTRVYPVTPGLNVFPFSVTKVNTAGTTAVGTYESWL